QVPDHAADRGRARAGMVLNSGAIPLVERHKLLHLALDRVELRHDRLAEVVAIGAQPVVRDAEVAHGADQTLDVRVHLGLPATANLAHLDPFVTKGADEARQLGGHIGQLDVRVTIAYGQHKAAQSELPAGFRDLARFPQPVKIAGIGIHAGKLRPWNSARGGTLLGKGPARENAGHERRDDAGVDEISSVHYSSPSPGSLYAMNLAIPGSRAGMVKPASPPPATATTYWFPSSPR